MNRLVPPPPKNLGPTNFLSRVLEFMRWCNEVYRVINSQLYPSVSILSTNTNLSTEQVIQITGVCTLTLPSAAATPGQTFTFDNNHGGVTTITAQAGELIIGAASVTISGATFITIYSDGTNWRAI